MQELRLVPHNAFTRRTQVLGEPAKELMITLRTVKCRHGKCAFCGLKNMDAQYEGPLGLEEFSSQLQKAAWAVRKEKKEIAKISLINNAHSTVSRDVVRKGALYEGIKFLKVQFPESKVFSFETRAYLSSAPVSPLELSNLAGFLECLKLKMEIATGVETADENMRKELGKGVRDKSIENLASQLNFFGAGLRCYFIYGLPGANPGREISQMAAFMAEIRNKYPDLQLDLYINRLYIPSEMRNDGFFRDAKPFDGRSFVLELQQSVHFCKERKIQVDVDVTGSDECLTSASSKAGGKFRKAMDEFNSTQAQYPLADYLR